MNKNEQRKNHILKRLVEFRVKLRIRMKLFHDDVTYNRRFELLFEYNRIIHKYTCY